MYDIKIIGIDEAGRGPLAGPLSVAAVQIVTPINLSNKPFNYLIDDKLFRDSKRLTDKKRRELYAAVLKSDNIKFEHLFIKESHIDKFGIKQSLNEAINNLLNRFADDSTDAKILLDGALTAPDNYDWESIKFGDIKILEIALASVIAKVKRDDYMVRMDKLYSVYKFHKHKGYGTKEHIDLIKKYGPCEVHRKTFLKKILSV